MTDKSKKTSDAKNGFFKSAVNSDFENRAEEIWCGGIDAEIENIFNDLRLIGNPQNQTLGEVLAKALEKEQVKNQANKSNKKSGLFAANFRLLQLREAAFCLLLTIMALLIMNLPNSFDDANLQRAELKTELICWKCY